MRRIVAVFAAHYAAILVAPAEKEWLVWFFGCLDRAFDGTDAILSNVLVKASVWERLANQQVNERQRKVLNLLLDGGFEGNLTAKKWGLLTKTSADTGLRDIADLIERGVLVKDEGGGRSTTYSLALAGLTYE